MPTPDSEVRGMITAQRKLEQVITDLHGRPVLNAMRDSTLMVQRNAKINTPVDTGRLRASITPEVKANPLSNTIMGVTGSNVEYAPDVEDGTPPHWVPIAELETWAGRHNINAYVVQRSIARRGTKAHKFMKNALENSRDYIIRRLGSAVKMLVKK